MPELPEVETIVRALRDAVVGRTIVSFQRIHPRVARFSSPHVLSNHAEGETITSLKRRGKYIHVAFENHSAPLVFHMGMSGRLLLGTEPSFSSHLRGEIRFETDTYLHYIDARMFGMIFIGDESAPPGYRKLGLDPLSSGFKSKRFGEILEGRSTIIKTLLLNQKLVAGIGNIYASEALFRACVHPEIPGGDLTPGQIRRLHHTLRRVLREAIDEMGTTLSDFRRPDGEPGQFANRLLVYGRDGDKCTRCGETIQRVVHHARSTFFCPRCQST